MIKILQVSKFYPPRIGGIERIVWQITENLSKDSRFKVEVLCCEKRGKVEIINNTKIYRAKILFNFWHLPISLKFFQFFRQLRNNCHIIDLHHPFPLADLALFLFPTKAKIAVHYHSDIVRQKILEIFIRPFIYHTLSKASKIFVSNPNLVKTSSILQKFSYKCVIVPFGVSLSKYQTPDFQKIQEIKKKYGEFILFVGRLSYYKGVSYLIRAIKDLKINLVIIGEGQEKNKLKQLAQKLGISHKVFFLPFQQEDDLINFYYACKFLVLPSVYRSEAFGIVLIEAMACKKPVISTELGTGTSWVNLNQKTGFVVKPKDVKALKEAIQLLLDQKFNEEMGREAFRRVQKEFTLEKMIEDTKKIYLGLLSSK